MKLATNYLSTILEDFISSSHLNAELYKSSSKGLHCIEKYKFLKKTFFKLLSTLRLKKDWKSLSFKMKHYITQNLIPTGWFCKFNYEILHGKSHQKLFTYCGLRSHMCATNNFSSIKWLVCAIPFSQEHKTWHFCLGNKYKTGEYSTYLLVITLNKVNNFFHNRLECIAGQEPF